MATKNVVLFSYGIYCPSKLGDLIFHRWNSLEFFLFLGAWALLDLPKETHWFIDQNVSNSNSLSLLASSCNLMPRNWTLQLATCCVTWSLLPYICYLILFAQYLLPGTWYLLANTKTLNTQCLLSDACNLIPFTS